MGSLIGSHPGGCQNFRCSDLLGCDLYRDLRNSAGVEFDENYLRSGTPSGCGHDERLFRWSPRTPTTGYFLATLRVALGNQ